MSLLLKYIKMPFCPFFPAIPPLPQVGPDDLHRNALLQLLVHLGKRDAFNELRTQQQVS